MVHRRTVKKIDKEDKNHGEEEKGRANKKNELIKFIYFSSCNEHIWKLGSYLAHLINNPLLHGLKSCHDFEDIDDKNMIVVIRDDHIGAHDRGQALTAYRR